MRIGVFAYNFNHWKTQLGLQNLVLSGYNPKVVFAADKIKLNVYRSNIRTSPRGIFLHHPRQIAKCFGIEYFVTKHNSQETSSLIKQYDLDVGVVLGARILKPLVISPFKKGVINMHPGILPENRGLNTIKWAILNDLPQGVTTHLIDEKIDRGLLIDKKNIEIHKDDNLADIKIKLMNLEQSMMLESLKAIEQDTINFTKIGKGNYNKPLDNQKEKFLLKKFDEYKEKWAEIL
tara:strand:+ start:1983 stop:2684 length:702 start_codon:yes stop_codon:yes gene_type:complete